MTDEQAPTPRIARFKPYYFKPVPGKTYLWCSCGRSASQPFCDGSHKGTGFEPVMWLAKRRGSAPVWLQAQPLALLRWLAQQSARHLRPR